MPNAAHELADRFDALRSGSGSPSQRLSRVAAERKAVEPVLTEMLELLLRVERMVDEYASIAPGGLDYMKSARRAWLRAVVSFERGWGAQSGVNENQVIADGDLAMLRALGDMYDGSQMVTAVRADVLPVVVADLAAIREGLDEAGLSDTRLAQLKARLGRVESLLSATPLDARELSTALIELLGLLVVTLESVPDEEKKERLREKMQRLLRDVATGTATNIISGALVAGVQVGIAAIQ